MEYPPPNPDKIEHFDHLVSIAQLAFPKIMRKFAEEKKSKIRVIDTTTATGSELASNRE
jgi:hypothetical protein